MKALVANHLSELADGYQACLTLVPIVDSISRLGALPDDLRPVSVTDRSVKVNGRSHFAAACDVEPYFRNEIGVPLTNSSTKQWLAVGKQAKVSSAVSSLVLCLFVTQVCLVPRNLIC